MHGFVHFIRSFIISFLHPIKTGASVVPTLQMGKLRPREVKGIVQLTSQWQAGSPGAFGHESCLLGTQLSFQRLQVRAAAPSRLWYFFSFLFCFLSDKSPFWGPSCLSPGVGRPCPGKEAQSVRDLPAEGQRAHWVHEGCPLSSCSPACLDTKPGPWWALCPPSPAQCPGLGRGVT